MYYFITKSLPTLFKLTNTGAIQAWTISYGQSDDGQHGIIQTTFGQLEGKMQVTEDIIKEGKNIGRSNATTAASQAKAEAEQKHLKKVKSGYSTVIETAQRGDKGLPGIDPMLAHPWEKQGKSMPFPCLVQPKLDGLRAICVVSGGRASFFSRTRKPFTTLAHLVKQVERLAVLNGITDMVLDGELYAHDFRENFNEIVSRVKRDDIHPDIEKIDYYIYDLPSSNVPFEDRTGMIKDMLRGGMMPVECPNLVGVKTYEVMNLEELKSKFELFLEDGFEGLMARAPLSFYEGKRSKGLLKYKTFQDDEFKIVGVQEGKGKLMGAAGSFVCETKTGKKFNAKLKGELFALKEYFENFESKYQGHMLTVKYFNMTPDQIPRFPIGIRLRPDE